MRVHEVRIPVSDGSHLAATLYRDTVLGLLADGEGYLR